MHKDFFGNICLTGGTTMLPGFAARLQKELNMLNNQFVSGYQKFQYLQQEASSLS